MSQVNSTLNPQAAQGQANQSASAPAEMVYRPQVDVWETPTELVLVADVPGAASDSVELDYDDGLLSVRAKIKPRRDENAGYLLREYGLGDFYRTFKVSEQIDVERIQAECAAGVLTIHLPKTEAAKPRKIEVRAG